MTKPDTLTPGSIKAKDLWLEILEGRSQNHFLRHGYYCTRQPDDGERTAGITPSEAREAETRFFQNTAPWDTSADKQRFGTKNLVKYLSGMLTQIINKVLPKLQREVENKLTACYTELRKLPKEVTSEPAAFVFGLLSSFCTDIRSRVSGIPGAEILVQQSRREFEALKHAIRGTAPRFIPLPSARDAPFSSTVDVLSDLDEDNETIINGLPPGTSTNEIYLKDMRVHIRRSMTRELPFNVPYPAKTLLIQRFQETWERECFACFEKIQRLFNRTLSQLMRDRFGRFRHLESQIEAAVMSLLQVRRTAASEQIEILLKFETTPFTQNTHYLSDATDKVLSRYKDIRGGRTSVRCLPEAEATAEEPLVYHADGKHEVILLRMSLHPKDHPVPIEQTAEEIYWHESPPRELPPKRKGKKSKGKSPWSLRHPTASTAVNASAPTYANARYAPAGKLGYVGLTADDLGKLNPPDEYEEELSVMAEVRAYFQVSYKVLALGTPDAAARCATYLSEELDIVSRRQELTGKKTSLEKAKMELMSASLAGVEVSAPS
ncbi:Dynamin central region-domain-containing protein [Fomitopsis serialis]|uniref:Dynamin central region-domain-containing protein n=1 Tax=Fomitopsis serialis TaxID=139415 RepID=UPI0020073D45|nr:Dynamin central region-domain-containing protein [Neoantrodia serialis]KAH9909434.1 Dynamin central region-domain-containing protein [Neoantrodia serialis]